MSRYESWGCGTFAKWLRRVCGRAPAMRSGTWDEWAEYERREKAEAPILYWFIETGLERIESAIHWPRNTIELVRWRIRSRFFLRIHSLPTGSESGDWLDLDSRILYGCFNGLSSYVEIELADHQHVCSPEWFSENNEPYSRLPWWRSRNAGIAMLEHRANMSPSHEDYSKRQTDSAKEILALYLWWTEVRPARGDPMAVSGLGVIFDKTIESGVDFLSEKFEKGPEYYASSKMCDEITDRYEAEDTEMLIRLMRIRGRCWT